MRSSNKVLFLVIWYMLGSAVIAQDDIVDLYAEIKAGHLELISANGNGSSSGASVEASLLNSTDDERRINIHLTSPIYLKNAGQGQNMVATQVYLEDGGYFSDDSQSFIIIEPNKQVGVLFYAYCADFDLENPSDSDTFSIEPLPAELKNVSTKIVNFAAANPEIDLMAAAQVAIWLVQGETIDDIRQKFSVSESEEQMARRLLE